jgi:molecular chaperone GrpE
VSAARGGQGAEGDEAESTAASPRTDEEMTYLEQLQRLQAEFSNYRRRTQKERAQWEARAKGEVLSSLLAILDDLGRARAAMAGEPDGKDAEGLLLILSRLDDLLASMGLEVQKTDPGTPFDPDRHEAFLAAPSEEHPEGLILDTLQPGYEYQGLLLRPARVKVSSGPEEQASSAGESNAGGAAEPQPSEAVDPAEAG